MRYANNHGPNFSSACHGALVLPGPSIGHVGASCSLWNIRMGATHVHAEYVHGTGRHAPRGPKSSSRGYARHRCPGETRSTRLARLTQSGRALEEGEWLYNVYCAVCHGDTGQGDGTIASHFRRMPNLSAPHIRNYTDGWIYSIIREGGFNMPPFAQSMNADERWALVHFVKTFQSSDSQ